MDSDGKVRLSPASSVVHDPESPYVWCLTRDKKGTLYAGTGNDGKVFRIESGKASLFFDASELEVHAVAAGPDGRLYAATSPDGKVYAVDGERRGDALLRSRRQVHLGPGLRRRRQPPRGDRRRRQDLPRRQEGRGDPRLHEPRYPHHLPRHRRQGEHLRRHVAGRDRLPHRRRVEGLRSAGLAVPRGQGAGRRSRRRRLRRRDRRQGGGAATAPHPSHAAAAGAAAATAEVTVTESFSLAPVTTAVSASSRPADLARSGATKGAVLRLLPTGEVETLWSSSEDIPHSILRSDDGVLVGTGNKGKIYRIKDERTWSMVASFPSDQVTALCSGSGRLGVPGDVEPRKDLRPRGTPRRPRHVHVEGQGHRDRLGLGPAAVGGDRARGYRGPGRDPKREHRARPTRHGRTGRTPTPTRKGTR